MQYLKFCFHQGAGGRGYPREHLVQLNQAGIPFGAKATDTMPFDAQEIARQFPAIKNTVIYRRSVPPAGDPAPGGNPDVPQYTLAPREAAVSHWGWHKRNFPRELDPAITWVETINEPAQHFVFSTLEEAQQVPLFGLRTITQRPSDGRWVVSNGEWLAQFAIHTADLAINDGYRWAAFGWSLGEPETAVWHGSRMVEFLRRCAGNPERLAVALHEYSKTTGSIFAGDTWLVGRFQHFYGACEDNNVPYPTTLITEWGWTLNDVPPWSVAESHYLAAGELYARYPTIRTVAVWALNAGWGGIAEKAAAHIVPLQQLTLVTRFPDPQEPDPPNPPTPGDTWEERAWAMSVTEQIERGIPLNPNAGLQQAIFKAVDGRFTPVHRERTLDGKTFQAAEDVTGQKPRRVYVYEPGRPITYFLQPNGRPEIINAPIYWQRDPRWGSHLCGFGPKTIAEWGCLLCVYNALGEYWGLTAGREPNGENEWYKARGAFVGNNLISMAMSQAYPRVANHGWLPRGDAMHIMTQGYLARGIPVPARVDFRPTTPQWEQHWVMLVGYDAARNDYLMNDPWTGQTAVYVSDFYGIAGSDILECLYYTLDDAPPPVGDLIDQTRYYSPPPGQTYGPITIKTTSWDGDVRQQVQMHGQEVFVTKGHEIEVRRIDTAAGVIRFLLDDSPGDGKYYTVQSDDGWLPTAARVGDVFTRREYVRFYWKADCDPTGEQSTWTSQMKFAAFHARWVSPVNPAIVYENVSEWHWVLDGVVEEKYWLAPHRGYAGWWNRHGRSSYVREEIPVGQQGNNVFPGACYHPPVGVAYP
jgi:hypothetical protein